MHQSQNKYLILAVNLYSKEISHWRAFSLFFKRNFILTGIYFILQKKLTGILFLKRKCLVSIKSIGELVSFYSLDTNSQNQTVDSHSGTNWIKTWKQQLQQPWKCRTIKISKNEIISNDDYKIHYDLRLKRGRGKKYPSIDQKTFLLAVCP